MATTRYAAWTLAGIGAALAVIAWMLGTDVAQRTRLALAVAGVTALFAGAVWDDVIQRARGIRDERFAAIYYRAGYNAWLAMMSLVIARLLVAVSAQVEPPARPTIDALMLVGSVVFLASVAWFERTM